jgi:hypothetical protein
MSLCFQRTYKLVGERRMVGKKEGEEGERDRGTL